MMVSCPVSSRKQLQGHPTGSVKRATGSTVLAAAAIDFETTHKVDHKIW